MRIIHIEHGHSHTADRGEAYKYLPSPTKMVCPGIPAWVEKPDNSTRLMIEPCNVWAFVAVAMETCKSDIVLRVGTAVLASNDVVNLEGRRIGVNRDVTVLTTPLGPWPVQAECRRQSGVLGMARPRRLRAFSCKAARTPATCR